MYRTPRLGALPSGTSYTPTALEAANAAHYMSQLGYTIASGQLWSLAADGVFYVPAVDGRYVTFGWGRGDFASFPGPGQAAAAPAAAAPVTPAAVAQPVAIAPAVSQVAPSAPAVRTTPTPAVAQPVVASLVNADGSETPIAMTEVEAAASGAPFNWQDFVSALFASPAMQPVNAQLAQAAAPLAPAAIKGAIMGWVETHKTLVYGGAVAAGLGLVVLAARRGRRR